MAAEHIEKLKILIVETKELAGKVEVSRGNLNTIEQRKQFTADAAELAKQVKQVETSIRGLNEDIRPLDESEATAFDREKELFIAEHTKLNNRYGVVREAAQEQEKQIQAFNKATAEIE